MDRLPLGYRSQNATLWRRREARAHKTGNVVALHLESVMRDFYRIHSVIGGRGSICGIWHLHIAREVTLKLPPFSCNAVMIASP